MKVNTIYPAFMGEVNCYGIGVPCTFIRLAGCNLRCYFKTKGLLCDTPEALDKVSGEEMSVDEILSRVSELKRSVVCLTGGEPLLQDVSDLLGRLSYYGFHTVIETNGSRDISKYTQYKNVSFIVDYKGASSGENEWMKKDNWDLMGNDDYLKFVIDDMNDYNEAVEWINTHKEFKSNIAFGLFWGSELSYQALMQLIIRDKLNVYLNMQNHKMACLYDTMRKDLSGIFIPKEL